METTSLKRSLSLPLLTLYGIGAILGAGIYVLIGAVATEAGEHSPLSFLIAALVAGVTGFSYAELASKMPKSAGEAVYVDAAFAKPGLTQTVGLLVVFTGIVSSATMATGVVGYWQVFTDWPSALIICLFISIITVVACWGIRESAWLITIITLTEVLGLFYVLYAGGNQLNGLENLRVGWPKNGDLATLNGIALGGFIAFYAYIGFEDMVNVAEEVKQPERNLPISIVLALLISTLLYMAVAIIALAVVPIDQLAGHPAPLAHVVETSGYNSHWIAAISLVAIINGALVQIIMASRVLYGMSRMKQLPTWFGHINQRTSTPINATILCSLVVVLLALYFPLATLAKTTSFIILTIFCLVNIALMTLKARQHEAIDNTLRVPYAIPALGLILCVTMLAIQLLQLFN